MTKAQAIRRLKTLQEPGGDIEVAHSEADQVLCEVLDYLGMDEIVNEYRKVPKWFA